MDKGGSHRLLDRDPTGTASAESDLAQTASATSTMS